MKRSSPTPENDEIPSSPALSQSGSEDFKPDITPPPASKSKTKKTKAVPKTPTPRKKVKKESSDDSGSGGGGGNGEWTPEKKGVLIDRVIAAGYKVLDIGGLAKEVSDRSN